jgi:protein ImuA
LQLVFEKSGVTGFIHRNMPKQMNAVACVTRWKIEPVASELPGQMPGVGFPRWKVQLLKVRNGKPGQWQVQYGPQGLEYIPEKVILQKIYERQTA